MVVVEMICVRDVQVVVVRGSGVVVVVIAMAHIPVVSVRRLVSRSIHVARAIAGAVGMVCVRDVITVI
jgi:hypothetical protein